MCVIYSACLPLSSCILKVINVNCDAIHLLISVQHSIRITTQTKGAHICVHLATLHYLAQFVIFINFITQLIYYFIFISFNCTSICFCFFKYSWYNMLKKEMHTYSTKQCLCKFLTLDTRSDFLPLQPTCNNYLFTIILKQESLDSLLS